MKLLNTLIVTVFAVTNASPISGILERAPVSGQAKVREIYGWDQEGTWAENLVVRENGNLLVTLADRPELYEINPFKKTSELIHRFHGYTSLLGITEVAPDVFTVAAGNLTLSPLVPTPGSFSVWQVDYKRVGNNNIRVAKVADLTGATFINGMTTLDACFGTILLADCAAGQVIHLNTRTGKYTVVHDNPVLKPISGNATPIGVNGLELDGKWLYFTNTVQALYGRVPIDLKTGKASGPYEILTGDTISDDLVVKNGVGYLAGNRGNVIYRVNAQGDREVVAGNTNSTLVAGATAAVFGRTKRDKNVLYISTAGTDGAELNGAIEWGKVKAVQL
ncbi:hypothetical protein NM208_g8178 [Fusarium decemcellulare]|uniref:Uncharacterized protein n=1 Tax=Fusarium decemcellulare TaxID=57161 RepID=A0ACC1S686_9HYPO|nr:hypothetical protein NM208_g8178 [Fusarium decemcellulare]